MDVAHGHPIAIAWLQNSGSEKIPGSFFEQFFESDELVHSVNDNRLSINSGSEELSE